MPILEKNGMFDGDNIDECIERVKEVFAKKERLLCDCTKCLSKRAGHYVKSVDDYYKDDENG